MEGPKSPYREEKPLTAIIPPDRRRQRMAALVVASMVTGIVLWLLGGALLEVIRERASAPKPSVAPLAPAPRDRIAPVTLPGPDGPRHLPLGRKMVVHVWLQGCQDCMPAFAAMQTIAEQGGLGNDVPVMNVSYGQADAGWATRYGVGQNLVYDQGGLAVVMPLGISTFTTLVIDENGVVLHRDRPDRPFFVERVRTAVGASPQRAAAQAVAPEPGASAGEGYRAKVERVLVGQRVAMKRACWEPAAAAGKASAKVTLTLTVRSDGTVANATATGDDPVVAKCIAGRARTWRMPDSPSAETTISVPFTFVSE